MPSQAPATKRSLGQRLAAAVAAFRDEPAPAAALKPSLWQRLRPQRHAQPQDQLIELLRNPLVSRLIQAVGLADLATPDGPHNNSNALVGAASVVESLVPILALRKTAEDLNELRPWWPLVLPLAGWVGYRTYRKERARVLSAKRVQT